MNILVRLPRSIANFNLFADKKCVSKSASLYLFYFSLHYPFLTVYLSVVQIFVYFAKVSAVKRDKSHVLLKWYIRYHATAHQRFEEFNRNMIDEINVQLRKVLRSHINLYTSLMDWCDKLFIANNAKMMNGNKKQLFGAQNSLNLPATWTIAKVLLKSQTDKGSHGSVIF